MSPEGGGELSRMVQVQSWSKSRKVLEIMILIGLCGLIDKIIFRIVNNTKKMN